MEFRKISTNDYNYNYDSKTQILREDDVKH